MDSLFALIFSLMNVNCGNIRDNINRIVAGIEYGGSRNDLEYVYRNPWLWPFIDMNCFYISSHEGWYGDMGEIYDFAHEHNKAFDYIANYENNRLFREYEESLEWADAMQPVSHRNGEIETIHFAVIGNKRRRFWEYRKGNRMYYRYFKRNDGQQRKTLRTHRIGH